MRKVFVSAVFACTLFVLGALAQSKQSQVGTWKMDASQSDFGSNPAPKSVTVTILKDTPTMLSWRVHMIDDKGKNISYSWSGPQDGSMHPVMQNGKELSKQSAKTEGDGSLHRHDEDPNGSSVDAYSKVSDDGNSITDEVTAKAGDGKESNEKWVYHRVMEKNGPK
jgi:hypothetical protein